ncbi:uncharacterized protein LOC116193531 [Punica granatum]|uniref:VTT domain-containing protein n=2 Tax=Punica granatum TaxID=22663 RepID=A0A218WGE9_PUNGR|nr:uncharacterized protein LOC116193531 [Punica granatum]OWM71905.1 hypothetical protein CDL15_Pgr017788 [Punica granatum]PKI69534.1 hypothetical protein CRG98_010062 [Punica granatum]
MTYYDEDKVVPELKLMLGEDGDVEKGDYVNLGQRNAGSCEADDSPPSPRRRWRSFVWYWVKLALLFSCLGLLAGVCIKWVWPYFMDKEIIPIINWETATFSPPILAVLVFITIALFPTLLLPSTPSMWVAGMTFGYGYGFLLIISGVPIGVSLPYFIGSRFHHKIQGWLEKYPKKASLIRSAGAGNWVHQLRAVTLIRISPFPYILYNYCAVATDVKYVPYILGSLIGVIPEIFVAMYTGIFIKTLADASYDRHSLSAPQIIFNVLGFLATIATTVIFTIYAKRQLKKLKSEEEPLLE